MKILFAYVPYLFQIPGYMEKAKVFDFEHIYTNPAGLTGSELSCFRFAEAMAKRGHDVNIITTVKDRQYEWWNGVRIIPFKDINDIGVLGGDWDVVYSWNEINALKFATHPKTLKVLNLQINDFNHGEPNFDRFVDVYTSPSESHRKIIGSRTPDHSKWEVIPNGCYPQHYQLPISKVDGRVIYASSPDRGLHWLLQIWPKILRAVPHAELRIFYGVDNWVKSLADNEFQDRDIQTLRNRACYVREALRRLNDHNVKVIGSISRNDMIREFCEAQVLAYPCDTIAYTEGFSVTLMEACASRTVPITTNVDALGEIYGESVPMVNSPIKDNINEYSDLVIKALTDCNFRSNVLSKTAKLSQSYDWERLTDNLVSLLERRRKA